MVLAVAFESLVKLAAFLIVGVYVTYVMFDGFGDLLGQAATPAGRASADRCRRGGQPRGLVAASRRFRVSPSCSSTASSRWR